MLRHQLPVYSPVTWRAIASGASAALHGDRRGRGKSRVEELLRARHHARDVLLTDSGTSALRLAIAGAVADSGRPVALPAYGCYDLATAAEGAGAPVALYDLDPATLGPDLESLASLRSLRPSALLVAHWFGHLADVPGAAAAHPDALVIEDAAQGVGGTLEGRPLGSFGSLSVLSFGRGKGTTGGSGGALLAHDARGERIVELARGQLAETHRGPGALLALAAQHTLGRPSLYGIPASMPFLHLGETVYHPPRAPRAITAAAVGVLSRVWDESDREVERRRAHAERLLAALQASAWLRPFAAPVRGVPGHLRLPALAADGERLAAALRSAPRLGVARGYPLPLNTLASLQPLLVAHAPLPGAALLASRLVTLPTHRFLTEADLARLERWIA